MWRIARSLAKKYRVEIHARAKFDHKIVDGIEIFGYPGGQSFRERYERMKIYRRKMLADPPDAIQINSPEQLPILIEIAKRRHVASIFDSYEFYPDAARYADYAQGTFKQPFFQWFSNDIIPFLVHQVDATLTSDNPTARYYLDKRIKPVQPLLNFPFQFELDRAIPERPSNHPELHYGGILTQDRGGTLILDALKMLKDRGRPTRMIFTGTPPTDPELLPWDRALISRGIEELVEHRGYVSLDENYDLMAMAKLAVMPTMVDRYRFNIPQKIFYYLGWGVPVITTKLAALADVLPNDLPGVYYIPEDATAIADTIAAVLSDERERVRAGAAAREWVRKNIRWEPEEEKLFALYERLLGE